jgi:hypothetical protein
MEEASEWSSARLAALLSAAANPMIQAGHFRFQVRNVKSGIQRRNFGFGFEVRISLERQK